MAKTKNRIHTSRRTARPSGADVWIKRAHTRAGQNRLVGRPGRVRRHCRSDHVWMASWQELCLIRHLVGGGHGEAENAIAGVDAAFRWHAMQLPLRHKEMPSAGPSPPIMALQRQLSMRLEKDRFLWPSAADGKVTVSTPQLSMLLERLSSRTPSRTRRPLRIGNLRVNSA